MTQQLAPDNVDRMLLRVAQEALDAEPWRRTAPVVVIHDVTGALSSWARKHELNVSFVQESAELAAEQGAITGLVEVAPSEAATSDAATVLYTIAITVET